MADTNPVLLKETLFKFICAVIALDTLTAVKRFVFNMQVLSFSIYLNVINTILDQSSLSRSNALQRIAQSIAQLNIQGETQNVEVNVINPETSDINR